MVPRVRWAPLVFVAAAIGCTSDEWPPLDFDESSSGSGELGEGVELVVHEPQSAGIYFMDEPVPFLAEVLDEDGLPLPDPEVFWSSDLVGPTLLETATGELDLPPGIHAIKAVSRLESGRVQSTQNGVYVQSRRTGVYSGDFSFSLAVNLGIPLAPVCGGNLEAVVNLSGTEVDIEPGTCLLNAIIAEFAVTYVVTGDVVGTTASGVVTLDFGLFASDVPFTAVFVDKNFAGIFNGELSIPLLGSAAVEGNFVGVRQTRYTEPPGLEGDTD